MKFRLPLGLLTAITAAMATCAIAESNTLTEDTIISGQSSAIMDANSDSLSYTSASSSDKARNRRRVVREVWDTIKVPFRYEVTT